MADRRQSTLNADQPEDFPAVVLEPTEPPLLPAIALEPTEPPLLHFHRWLSLILIIIGLGGAALAALRAELFTVLHPSRRLPVAKVEMPAYHIITSNDLVEITIPAAKVPMDAITSTASLTGSITLDVLKVGMPISGGQIMRVPGTMTVSNTAIVAVEGGPSLTFADRLHKGMVVSAWIADQGLVQGLLVLDVVPLQSSGTATTAPRRVVILAVPAAQQKGIREAAAEGKLSFSLAP